MPTLNFENSSRKYAIRLGLPIKSVGLTFYPIEMRDYEIFNACKPALLLRQAAFPARYLPMDFLSAIFAMEIDASSSKSADNDESNEAVGVDGFPKKSVATEPHESGGLIAKLVTLLFLSLRIDIKQSIEQFGNIFRVQVKDGKLSLTGIAVTDPKSKVETVIDTFTFSSVIRPLIAEQNGLELPDESQNIDLVRAAELKKQYENRHAKQLNLNADDLIASVAYNCHIRAKEIWEEWTVREFEETVKAIDRDKRHMLCGQAEMSGMVSFKEGNPAPSWQYDILDTSLGTVSVKNIVGKISGNPEGGNGDTDSNIFH